VSGTKRRSQSRPLSFGEFYTTSTVIESRKDGFYYDT
jgi:hypothetical protein